MIFQDGEWSAIAPWEALTVQSSRGAPITLDQKSSLTTTTEPAIEKSMPYSPLESTFGDNDVDTHTHTHTSQTRFSVSQVPNLTLISANQIPSTSPPP